MSSNASSRPSSRQRSKGRGKTISAMPPMNIRSREAVSATVTPKKRSKFQKDWAGHSGAVAVWQNNFTHVEQLFSYGSAVRKVMYTTNAIESVNSSFRKVTKKGSFPNEDAVFKLLYLRVQELYQKWSGRRIPNWALVRNQLLMDERMAKRMEQYDTTY